jgi:hypothetical protein
VNRRGALWLFGLAALMLLGVLALLDLRMEDAGGPGIVSFELAGSTERAGEILVQWGEDGRSAARLSLWLDFPFLLAYGAFLSLAVMAMRDGGANRGWLRYAKAGALIAVLPWVAAAFDAVEDVNLLLTLDGHGGGAAPALATGFAIAKFIGLAVVAAYLIGGPAALGVRRLRRAS